MSGRRNLGGGRDFSDFGVLAVGDGRAAADGRDSFAQLVLPDDPDDHSHLLACVLVCCRRLLALPYAVAGLPDRATLWGGTVDTASLTK